MTDVCAYCGAEANDDRRFCGDCWDDLPGEIKDRIAVVWQAGGFSDRFVNAVEGAIKFLVWLDGQEESDA